MILKRGTDYDMVVCDGKLRNDVLYCIIREPHFKLKYEITVGAALIGIGFTLMVLGGKLSSRPNGELAHPYILMTFMALSAVPIIFGMQVFMDRIYDQVQYRRRKIGRNVLVLTKYDFFWGKMISHIPRWSTMAEEMEKETVTGRILEGIILLNLKQIKKEHLTARVEGNLAPWKALEAVHRKAFETAQQLNNAYSACELMDKQPA